MVNKFNCGPFQFIFSENSQDITRDVKTASNKGWLRRLGGKLSGFPCGSPRASGRACRASDWKLLRKVCTLQPLAIPFSSQLVLSEPSLISDNGQFPIITPIASLYAAGI